MNSAKPPLSAPDVLLIATLACVMALSLAFDSAVWGATPLWVAIALLLVCGGLRLPRLHQQLLGAWPFQALFTLLLVGLLAVLYQLSLSQDLSFIPTWILGAALLSYWLLISASQATRLVLWWCLVAIGAVVALYSCWEFLRFGVRASKPINDPNNYASQLYLLWIPSLHLVLQRRWTGTPSSALWAALGLAGTALVTFTMFATESRAGMIIMAVALCCWWWLAVSRDYALKDLLLHTAVAGLVFVACTLLLGMSGVAPGGDNTLSGGMAVRFGLIGEAWQLYLERPFGGSGLGVFAAFYAARRPLWDQVTAGRFVHNDYLQFLLEGGPLLLIALLCVGCWALWLLRCSLKGSADSARFTGFGFALAACALFGHAHINFVFYLFTLPLLLAVVLAFAQPPLPATEEADNAVNDARPSGPLGVLGGRGTFWVPLAFGWVAWGYLAVDVVSGAVIAGNRGVPFVDGLRSADAMQTFARLAQRINDDRGLPYFADAAISAEQAARSKDDTKFAYALRTYRRALEIDPWNTNAYMALYDLFRQRPALLRSARPDEYPDELLQRALGLNRQYLPALDALLELFRNDQRRRDEVLLQFVAPWLELIARADIARAEGYLAELTGVIEPAEHERLARLLAALKRKRMAELAARGSAVGYSGPGV